ncbi:MAG: hypothetical protein ACTHNU_13145 [Gaiellales bacterium]
MSWIRGLGHFLYEFVVGDDWRIAAGVVVAFAVTWVLTRNEVNAWWLIPAFVAALLGGSVLQVARARR